VQPARPRTTIAMAPSVHGTPMSCIPPQTGGRPPWGRFPRCVQCSVDTSRASCVSCSEGKVVDGCWPSVCAQLKHDGQLYGWPEEYEPRAKRINQNPRAGDAVVSGRRPEAGAEFSVDRCGWPSPFIREFNPRTVHVRLPRVRMWFSLWVFKRLGMMQRAP
jgi:hypothetical protein